MLIGPSSCDPNRGARGCLAAWLGRMLLHPLCPSQPRGMQHAIATQAKQGLAKRSSCLEGAAIYRYRYLLRSPEGRPGLCCCLLVLKWKQEKLLVGRKGKGDGDLLPSLFFLFFSVSLSWSLSLSVSWSEMHWECKHD